MRQATRGTILAAAGLLGIVTAVLIYSFLSAQARKVPERVPVVIAKQGIAPGTVVDADMLEVRMFAADIAPGGAVRAREAVIGKVCSVPIKAGEPISPTSVASKNRLAQMIPPFMRAVTVAVDPIIGVGGFLKPGDHVDVVATFTANQGTLTKTVLQDVTLVAIGPRVVGEEKPATTTGSGKTSQTTQAHATLVVLPSDAEKLILADDRGKLRLILRRSDDFSRITPKGVTSRSVMGIVPSDVPDRESRPSAQVNIAASPAWGPPPMSADAAAKASGLLSATQPAGAFASLQPLPLPGLQDEKATKHIEIIRGTQVEEAVVSD